MADAGRRRRLSCLDLKDTRPSRRKSMIKNLPNHGLETIVDIV